MARLDRLRVEGYKSIAEADLILGDLNVLIGANGAGKSNLIGALALLGSIVNERLQLAVGLAGGASTLLHRGSFPSSDLVLKTWMGPNRYEAALTRAPRDTLFFKQERVSYLPSGAGRPSDEFIGTGTFESVLQTASAADPVVASCRTAMSSWEIFHFDDTTPRAPVRQKQPLDDNQALRADGANLAPLLYRIERTDPDIFRLIVDSIKLAAPFFDKFQLRPDRLDPSRIQLEWKQTNSTGLFYADNLSDGTLRFMMLVALLFQPDAPSLIVIDEPELGLHPFAITLLADALRSCATSRQVIVSTQSVTLLNHLDPQDVIVAENVGGSSTFHRPDWPALEAWLSDYSVGELWEKNLIGGRPS